MHNSERGIDHIVLAVKDLEVAQERFSTLGFTCTPRAVHPFGTGNRLLQFANSFVEIVTVVEPENLVPMSDTHFSFGAQTVEFLKTGEGMNMMVMSSDDVRADNAGWAARGLKTYDAVDFSRHAGQPDGSKALVSFSTAFVVDPLMPAIAFFICQQHTPENFWKPMYQNHENGATNIVGITISAPQPERHRGFFEAYLPEGRIEESPGRLTIEAPRGRIEVLRPEGFDNRLGPDEARATGDQAAFSAITLSVTDLEALGELFTERQIDHRHLGSRILLPAHDCFGLAFEFIAA